MRCLAQGHLSNLCVCVSLQHEKASLDMLNHLIAVNNLEPVMKCYGLELPVDLFFIEELIFGKRTDPDHPEIEVCTLTLPTEGLVLSQQKGWYKDSPKRWECTMTAPTEEFVQ